VVDCSWMKIWYVNIFLVIYIRGCYKSAGLMIGLGFVEDIIVDLLSYYEFNMVLELVWTLLLFI
jgi:hypothetical protein